MFTVYHSNQLDLLKTLISILIERAPLEDPLQSEIILVQSPGMAQWLQIQLAEQTGIAANIVFPLPATFIWEMFTKVLPGIPKESAFSKDAMMWKLMELLPQQLKLPEFAALSSYLTDGDLRKTYQLASRIADLYDQYLVYRPQWISCWERGEHIAGLAQEQQWQACLWQRLVQYTAELGQPQWHRANLYSQFISTLEHANSCPEGLPTRIFICGIPALPPIYLRALQALSKHIDVHLMFTNPCRYYWGDIQDNRFLARLQNRKRHHCFQQKEQNLFRDPQQAGLLFNLDGEQQLNNPLLASWGKLGRDYLCLLAQIENVHEVDGFVLVEPDNLLHVVQHDILELEDHCVVGLSAETFLSSKYKRKLAYDDHSISFHACHSQQREVEVLHDQLLAMLAADPMLDVRDIIVMVADIDSYTPYIQAIFGNAQEQCFLPFAISDRNAYQTHPILQAFITLLDLPQSRFNAEQVLSLLEVPALAERFSIQEEGLRLLRRWVAEVGIRWGMDDDNVKDLDLPATGQHTWQFGMMRMLLGYAMDSSAGDWCGVLPYDETSGLIAELVGQLAELLSQLRNWRHRLSQPYSLSDWSSCCQQLLDAFFAPQGEAQMVLALIAQQWQQIISHGLAANYSAHVPLTLLRDEMVRRLQSEHVSQRFLAGQLNFCTLMPMRSVPFKIVCLLGMNDGVYPRLTHPSGFDLMATQFQRGDRSRRDDDRYLFLEAVLSAQQRLYISYIGRAIQDNSERYPSVLVSELREYLEQNFYLDGDEALNIDESARRVGQHLLTWHTRAPFSVENYQTESVTQSYATEWLPAARGVGIAQPFFHQVLPANEITDITFDDLLHFYRHPIRAFFRQRLGVYFVLEETELPDKEPFILEGLSRYQLNEKLLAALISGEDIEKLFHKMRAAGILPYGALGEIYWQNQQQEMVQLAQQVSMEYTAGQSIEIDLTVDGINITGWLRHVQPDGLLRWRPAKLSVIDGLLLWLEHLVYCCQGGQGNSRIYGRQKSVWHFLPLEQAEAYQHLQHLVTGYRRGLQQPLMLLNKSGWAWLSECYQKETAQVDWDETVQAKARHKFLQVWQGDLYVKGEGEDYYVQRIFRQLNNHQLAEMVKEAENYLLPLARFNIG